ncbi:AAA family ATPase [Nitrospira sp. M1]
MYLNFYGITKKPFHTTPDPRFLFSSATHREALSSLIYGVEERQGFITIIGEVGVGKTTILRTLLERLDASQDRAVYIYNPNLTFTDLLKCLLSELGHHPTDQNSSAMVQQLQDVLIQEYQKGGTIVLLIDEAQNMPLATLENLRMLSNLETTTDKLLQIVLIGQPELEDLLNQDALRQLKQRITIRATIRPLTKSESFDYIQYRLAKAGAKSSTIFSKPALTLIIHEARGIPRRLNILCDNTLLTGYAYQVKPIPGKIAKEVISDLKGTTRQTRKKWIAAAIAAGVFIFSIPWIRANTDFFLFESLDSQEAVQLTQNVVRSPQKTESTMPASRTMPLEITEPIPTPVAPRDVLLNKSYVERPHMQHADQQTRQATHIENPKTQEQSIDEPKAKLPQAAQPPLRQREKQPIHAKSSEQSQEFVRPPQSIARVGELPLKVYHVKRGDTLDKLIRSTYGRSSPQHIRRVLEQNPHIRSAKWLFPGQTITFPRIRPELSAD